MNETAIELSPQRKHPKKMGAKARIIIGLLVIIAILSGGSFFYYQTTESKRAKYEQGLQALETLESEQSRCSALLSQDSGNFSDYEYCRKLLQVFTQ